MIYIDLDAHQGNGVERDCMGNDDVYILDMYGVDIFPTDMCVMNVMNVMHRYARGRIDCDVPLGCNTTDDEYLRRLERALDVKFDAVNGSAGIVIYNAGTDVLKADRIGCQSLSINGIVRRDEMVFKACRGRGTSIVMLTSGGYSTDSATAVTESLLNLFNKGIIS